jgi:hypothetical protein
VYKKKILCKKEKCANTLAKTFSRLSGSIRQNKPKNIKGEREEK